jgi:hypothetical protein
MSVGLARGFLVPTPPCRPIADRIDATAGESPERRDGGVTG